jgi:hypothetical protein
LLQKLNNFPVSEDLLFMLARVAQHQKQKNIVLSILKKLLGLTSSYFWALQAGRLAEQSD